MKPLGTCAVVSSVRERKGSRIALGIRWLVMLLFDNGIARRASGFWMEAEERTFDVLTWRLWET